MFSVVSVCPCWWGSHHTGPWPHSLYRALPPPEMFKLVQVGPHGIGTPWICSQFMTNYIADEPKLLTFLTLVFKPMSRYYWLQSKLREGKVFRRVCLFTWGGSSAKPPGPDPPRPWDQTIPLGPDPPPSNHKSGRYASYWNAFLLIRYTYLLIEAKTSSNVHGGLRNTISILWNERN